MGKTLSAFEMQSLEQSEELGADKYFSQYPTCSAVMCFACQVTLKACSACISITG